MKQGNQFFLQVRVHIDEQVAAADQVELGKRRVPDQIMLRKDQHVTDAFVHPVNTAIRFSDEKPRESFC